MSVDRGGVLIGVLGGVWIWGLGEVSIEVLGGALLGPMCKVGVRHLAIMHRNNTCFLGLDLVKFEP